MIDVIRARQDCAYVIEKYEGTVAGGVAAILLRVLDNPTLVTPEGYSLVRKPELLGIGVPRR